MTLWCYKSKINQNMYKNLDFYCYNSCTVTMISLYFFVGLWLLLLHKITLHNSTHQIPTVNLLQFKYIVTSMFQYTLLKTNMEPQQKWSVCFVACSYWKHGLYITFDKTKHRKTHESVESTSDSIIFKLRKTRVSTSFLGNTSPRINLNHPHIHTASEKPSRVPRA